MLLDGYARQVAAGTLRVWSGRLVRLDELVEAHRWMERNEASGKP